MSTDTADREIITTRVLDAPRELVVKKFWAIEGAKQTLGRLSEHLAKMSSGEIGGSR